MPRPVTLMLALWGMGGSTSLSRRNKAVANRSKVGASSVPVTTDDEDYLDSSTSSDGEWDDLPPFPVNLIGTTRSLRFLENHA